MTSFDDVPVDHMPVPWSQQVEAMSHTTASELSDNEPSHNDAPTSYAEIVQQNLPDASYLVIPNGSRTVGGRTTTLTEFEREHFHPLNVTPERPCTAYFNVTDNSITTKEIFEALHKDDRGHATHPATRRLTFVNIYDAPHELPDTAIQSRLAFYGRIHSIRRGRVQDYPEVLNGVRHLRMELDRDIPCFIRFGRFQVRVKYDGQPKTCRKCNSTSHLIKDCTNTICFNCDNAGHVSRDCTEDERCCICKATTHRAIDCPHSWYKRPLLSDNAEARPFDARPADANAESNVEATVQPTDEEPASRILDTQGSLVPNPPSTEPINQPLQILQEVFASEDGDTDFSTADEHETEGESDDETSTEDTTAEEAEDAMETEAAAAAAKKRRKLPKKVANQASVETGPCPPSLKPTRPTLVTSKKLRSCEDTQAVT